MIELPETYVLAEQINQALKGKTILNATANAHPHAFAWYTGDPNTYQEKLAGKTFLSANPGTGYTCGGNTEILFDDMLMVLSTPVKYHQAGAKLPPKHQLLLEFEDFSHLSCTVQMWGSMFCFPAGEDGLPENFTCNRCPDPLTEGFNEAYFEGLLKNVKPNLSVKAFLATEQRIPGLGNGVLQDILFNARIHPKRKLETLNAQELEALFHHVKTTLLQMRMEGGRDTERDLYGANGGYQTILSANTLKAPCPICGATLVREAYLGGNIYYCPTCQPLKKGERA